MKKFDFSLAEDDDDLDGALDNQLDKKPIAINNRSSLA